MQIAVLCGAFCLSGASALIFETLWLRLCGLAFGNAIISAALVLSSFMAGLAVGSSLVAFGPRPKIRPLRFYAALEAAIGVLGLAVIASIPSIGMWVRPAFVELSTHPAASQLVRFALCFALLCIPAAAMGATLPTALSDALFQQASFRRSLGFFYGSNTLGAVLGAVVGESWLINRFGIPGAAIAATVCNLVAAAAVLLLRLPPGSEQKTDAPIPPRLGDCLSSYRLLVVSFGAGTLLLSLELVWFRFLRLYVLSSPMAFAVMLAVVLAGLALGSLSAGFFHRVPARTTLISQLLLLTSLVVLFCYAFFPIDLLQQHGNPSWRDYILNSWWEVAVLSVALMFPTSYLSGLLFPIITDAVHGHVGDRASSVGLTTLCNTIGAALGPLLTTFILLPAVGFQQTLVVAAAAYVALALFVTDWNKSRQDDRSRLTTFVLLAVAVLAFGSFPYRRAQDHFAHARQPYEADGARLIARHEGLADTWQLLERDFLGQPYYWRLVSDAFSMSSTQFPNQRYMRLFAYLPLALQTHPENALLICYGCGVTADALTKDSRLEHIDVVDISKEVFALAEHYPAREPLQDGRVSKFIEDGRFFLEVSSRHYDVITGEPPPPKIQGTVNLYTRDFFEAMKGRLKQGGIATFWLPIYQLTVSDTKAILRGFHDAFPNASVWASSDEEWIMMGINQSANEMRPVEVAGFWDNGPIRADLNRIGVARPEQLAALFLMDGRDIDELTSGTTPLTDMYPKRLSDVWPDRNAVHDFAGPCIDAAAASRRFRHSTLVSHLWAVEVRSAAQPLFSIREVRYRSTISGASTNLGELDFLLRKTDLSEPVLEVFHTDANRVAISEQAASARTQTGLPAEAVSDLVAGALARRDFGRAIKVLEEQTTTGSANRMDGLLLTYLYCLDGKVDAAEKLAMRIPKRENDDLVKWLWGTLQAEFGFHPPG